MSRVIGVAASLSPELEGGRYTGLSTNCNYVIHSGRRRGVRECSGVHLQER